MGRGDGLRHALLAHGGRAHVHGLQLFPQLIQQLPVHPVFHVTQHHVRPGTGPHLQRLQRQLRIPDAAAQQGGVLHDALPEAVVAAPQHLAGIRLLHGAQGELLGIQHHAAGEAVDDEQGLAGEYRRHRLQPVRLHCCVADADVAVGKGLQCPHVLQRRDGQPCGDSPLQHCVVGVAVDHP